MTQLRRFVVVLAVLVIGVTVMVAAFGQARAASPEQTALNAAIAVREPGAKLAALEKVRADFPESSTPNLVDTQILNTLVANFADRTAAISEVFERIIGRIPADGASDTRLNSTLGPVGTLVAKKLMLDRAEALVTAATSGLDREKLAQAQKDAAARNKRPEPTQSALDSSFGLIRARGVEMLGRIAAAKGDSAAAEKHYAEAVKLNPAFGAATTALVDIYLGKKDYASAENILKDAISAAPTPASASRPTMALVDVYTKKGDSESAETLLKDTLKANPTLNTAMLALARLEAKRGDSAAALEHFLNGALAGNLNNADDASMREVYRKVHNGSEAGLEAALDSAYREKFPNPIKPEPYKSTVKRDRVVLLEMFTGSGCGPCVSADLAFDAVQERYPAGTIVPLAYHQNIPAPDPMVIAGGVTRREYYQIRGVPTFNIDGGLGKVGGGARTASQRNYDDYIAKIDKELESPARAVLAVSATGDGDTITAHVKVSRLPKDAKDLRLHILLVEKELHFGGENGIRFHSNVVRAMAGEKGAGIPISQTGTTPYAFNLAAIRADVTATLKAEMEKRHNGETTPREYVAEGRAYVAIDPAELMVVAFIQEGAYQPPPAAAPAAGVEGVEGAPAPVPPAGAAAATPPPATGAAANAPSAPKPPSIEIYKPNVLQATMADVVFPAATKSKGGSR